MGDGGTGESVSRKGALASRSTGHWEGLRWRRSSRCETLSVSCNRVALELLGDSEGPSRWVPQGRTRSGPGRIAEAHPEAPTPPEPPRRRARVGSGVPAAPGTGAVTCGVLVPFTIGLHFPRDGADDAELGEEENPLRAFKLGSRSSKVVDAAQADLGLLGLQNHHGAVDRGD